MKLSERIQGLQPDVSRAVLIAADEQEEALTKRVAELEERLEQYDSQVTAVRVTLSAAGIPEYEPYPDESGLSEHERSLRAGGRMLRAPERIGRLTKRVAELEFTWTPVAQESLPAGPGVYALEFRTTAKYRLEIFDNDGFAWTLLEKPLAHHPAEFDEFRHMELPEAL
jgi:hypothetical protein